MKKNSGEKNTGIFKGKKRLVAAGAVFAVGLCAFIIISCIAGGDKTVDFHQVKENEMPSDITSEIIPGYKSLERALACVIDDDVYVVVTRGEKPTSGFGISVDKLVLEEKNGKENLIVYALFEDPKKEMTISQIITYPTAVVKTGLKQLPDTVELRIQY